MKTTKTILAAIIAALTIAIASTYAQTSSSPTGGGSAGGSGGTITTPPKPAPVPLPIYNQGVLRDFASMRVAYGTIEARADSILPNSSNRVSLTTERRKETSMDQVMNELRGFEPSFAVADTNDTLAAQGSLYDGSGNDLFNFHDAGIPLERKWNGTYWISSARNRFSFRRGYSAPIPYPGVETAVLIPKKTAGEEVSSTEPQEPSRTLRVDNGSFFYPYDLTGKTNLTLIVSSRDEKGILTSDVYEVGDGTLKESYAVNGSFSLDVEGLLYYGENPNDISLYGMEIRGVVVRFLVLTPDGEKLRIKMGGRSKDGETVIAILLRQEEEEGYRVFHLLPGTQTEEIDVPSGELPTPTQWRVIYALNENDIKNVPTTTPDP